LIVLCTYKWTKLLVCKLSTECVEDLDESTRSVYGLQQGFSYSVSPCLRPELQLQLVARYSLPTHRQPTEARSKSTGYAQVYSRDGWGTEQAKSDTSVVSGHFQYACCPPSHSLHPMPSSRNLWLGAFSRVVTADGTENCRLLAPTDHAHTTQESWRSCRCCQAAENAVVCSQTSVYFAGSSPRTSKTAV
jgi:hypothetical protein